MPIPSGGIVELLALTRHRRSGAGPPFLGEIGQKVSAPGFNLAVRGSMGERDGEAVCIGAEILGCGTVPLCARRSTLRQLREAPNWRDELFGAAPGERSHMAFF